MALNEQEVLAYLRQHPDFLHIHARALGFRPDEAQIRSFNQGSLNALTQKTERMAQQLAQMLDDAESNRTTTAKLQAFNQQLLAAKTVGQLWRAAAGSLNADFSLPQHGFAVLHGAVNRARIPSAIDATTNTALQVAWADLTTPLCGTRLPEPAYALLNADAPLAESFLQLPIRHNETLLAVLVVGHVDAAYFHAGLETDLVAAMACSLAVAMARIMGLSA